MWPGRTKKDIQGAWRVASWLTFFLAGLWGLLAVVGFITGHGANWLPVVWLAVALFWTGVGRACRRRSTT